MGLQWEKGRWKGSGREGRELRKLGQNGMFSDFFS